MLLPSDATNILGLIQERTQVTLERLMLRGTKMTFAIIWCNEEGYLIEELAPKDYFKDLQGQVMSPKQLQLL